MTAVQLYLPPNTMVNRDFLKAVLSNKKKLMPLLEVKFVQVPKFDELSVVNLQDMLKEDDDFMMYFPDKLPKGRNPGREYFFNILNTLKPEYLAHLIEHASKQRYTGANEDRKNETIEITDEWA